MNCQQGPFVATVSAECDDFPSFLEVLVSFSCELMSEGVT